MAQLNFYVIVLLLSVSLFPFPRPLHFIEFFVHFYPTLVFPDPIPMCNAHAIELLTWQKVTSSAHRVCDICFEAHFMHRFIQK